jgi:hypothetical protein
MASQEVLTALESLHREIEKLEPAIKHVETAQQVTELVKTIPRRISQLLNQTEALESRHKSELKNLFQKELFAIVVENKELQKNTIDIQRKTKGDIEGLFIWGKDWLKEASDKDSLFKEQLRDLLEDEINKITRENYNLQNSTKEIQKQVVLEQEALMRLREKIEEFFHFIKEINLPQRLDTLDSKVTKIGQDVHSLQIFTDGLERNICELLIDIQNRQKELHVKLQDDLEQTKTILLSATLKAARRQQTLNYITWTVLLVSMLITSVFN